MSTEKCFAKGKSNSICIVNCTVIVSAITVATKLNCDYLFVYLFDADLRAVV